MESNVMSWKVTFNSLHYTICNARSKVVNGFWTVVSLMSFLFMFQDRYVLIEDCKELADYYEALVDTISQFSLVVSKDGSLAEEDSSFKGVSLSKFVEKGSGILRQFITNQYEKNRINLSEPASRSQESKSRHLSESRSQLEIDSRRLSDSSDTVIFPTVQMGLYNITQVSEFMFFFLLISSQYSFLLRTVT